MTAAELLKPRFEVIAEYPNCHLEVGEVFSWDDILDWLKYIIKDPAKYPHIFKSLNWWEHRKAEDMPKKVISKAFKGSENDVIEIQEWDMELLIGWINKKEKTCCSIRSWNPEFGYFPID